jgi:hypothetical protein
MLVELGLHVLQTAGRLARSASNARCGPAIPRPWPRSFLAALRKESHAIAADFRCAERSGQQM